MLVEWLRDAVTRHGLRVAIYGAGNAALERECRSAGLGAPIASHPAKASVLRDAAITWRLLGRLPAGVPVLLAPGALQQSILQCVAVLLRGRRLAGYTPMAYSSRRMGFRGGSLRDWIAGHVIRRVHTWITISREQRDLLVEKWRIAPPVFVVPNRLALLERKAGPAREPNGAVLRVLFAGRFDANQKGLDWLCERLRVRHAEWRGRLHFTFKGDGDFAPELARLRREIGADHVEVSAWGEVSHAMAAADVLLLPSRYEGLPLVALEAAHYGLPVVASRHAGVSDLVPASCLFDFGDADAMWAALEAMRDCGRRAAALAYFRRRVALTLSAASFGDAVDRVVAAMR